MPAALKPGKRSSCRMLKIECDSCGCILRGSAAALRTGLPSCACGGDFEVPNLADLELVDPHAFEVVIGGLGEGAHNGLMRELGYDQAISSTNARSIGTRQCRHSSCKHLRANALAEYCAEHLELAALPF